MTPNPTRRAFLKSTTLASSALVLEPWRYRRLLGANERLDLGVIGVAGRGGGNLQGVESENLVALCDVDRPRLEGAAARHPSARTFADWRELLEMESLDGVVISTPDHHHAPASARALKRGLHVYCEKPLTHTVEEARTLTRLAAEKGLATQMGTQNHEHPGYLRTVEWIRAGLIGDVREVHVITDRPGRWWPQGLDRPSARPAAPATLDWDLWLGPAPSQPYQPEYVPFKWRGWWDFGCGAIGDMAIHLMDPAYWALRLGGKVRVHSEGPPPRPHCGPEWMKTHFQFPAREGRPAVDVHWYEGAAPIPADHPAADRAQLPMNGSLFVGDAGRLSIAHGADRPQLLAPAAAEGFEEPAETLPRSPGHHRQWIEACKTGRPTSSPFSYAGPFTELVLLGNVSFRAGGPLSYDPATMEIEGPEGAAELLKKEYRPGWEL